MNASLSHTSPVRLAAQLLIAGLVIALLVWAKTFLIPVVLAVLLAALVNALAYALRYVSFGPQTKTFFLPRWLTYVIGGVGLVGVVWLVSLVVGQQVTGLALRLPEYEEQMVKLLAGYGVDAADVFARLNLSSALGSGAASLARTFADISGKFVLIVIYAIFMLVEYPVIRRKMRTLLMKYGGAQERAGEMVDRMSAGIQTYFKIKALASLLTATLCYVVMVLFGLEYALVWALLIFFLNFIPTVGSIIAVVFPSLLTLVQFAALGPWLALTLLLVGMQILVGNVFEPRLAGSQLGISPLAIILSIIGCGFVWGPIGMLISIPLVIIVRIVAEELPGLEPLALFLSRGDEVVEGMGE